VNRGRLRIYLGAAPGVGKTYAVLDEARRRHERGTDVVVAYADTRGRPRTAAMLHDLEIVPRRTAVVDGHEVEELDVDAVLARLPSVAVVDDLAHTNPPGSRNRSRHQDVAELLDNGIDVLATVGIESMQSLQDVVERVVGVRPADVVPDGVVRGADQVELVDMTPEALRRRVVHGNVVPAAEVDAALDGRFRPDTLAALRELALLWVADQVDEGLHDSEHAERWETRERVVVALTGAPSGDRLIRRAARLARRSTAELIGVHVQQPGRPVDQARLEEHRRLLADLGGRYHEVVGPDIASALCDFARARHATQLVLGASRRSRWAELRRGSIVGTVLREAGDLDVHVIGDDGDADHDARRPGHRAGRPLRTRRQGHVGARRRLAAAGASLTLIAVLTAVLDRLHPVPNLPTDLLLFLLVVLGAALLGGFVVGVVTAVVSAVSVTWFLTPPVHTFTISGTGDSLALATFLFVSVAMSALVSLMSRRSADAARARLEAEGLARAAGSLAGGDDAVGEIVEALCATFDRTGVVLVARDGHGWRIEAAAGAPIDPDDERLPAVDLPGGARLVHDGPGLNDDDRRVLAAFAAQLGHALERRHLEAEATRAAATAQGDRLRTAILRAVSHDLRTPLASIKASATSLLQDDIAWTPDAQREFLVAIDEEADRLDAVVGDLLDMSRLEAGVVRPTLSPVDLDEVVQSALASLSEATAGGVARDVPAGLPPVLADPALLQRSVANLVANALRHGSADGPPSVVGRSVGHEVELRVVDHGPGVPARDREQLFEPFQRLGDRQSPAGVGLGLAVARGFVDAMGGRLRLDDTPGGGLTAVVTLPAAPATVALGAP
jgi:two-component system, OmpR family, sensor histidine kinase KdpD